MMYEQLKGNLAPAAKPELPPALARLQSIGKRLEEIASVADSIDARIEPTIRGIPNSGGSASGQEMPHEPSLARTIDDIEDVLRDIEGTMRHALARLGG